MNALTPHKLASDNYTIAGLPIRTRHAHANAVANINVCASKRHPLSVVVLVGPDDEPGWRTKDGEQAQQRRAEVAQDAAAHLGLDPRSISVQARYSRLAPQPDGMLKDRNTGGYYAPNP